MQIVPRLARPAAVAALAAAALAIPATSASAQPSQDCLQARVATGNTLMSDAIELAGQGKVAGLRDGRPVRRAGRTRPP